MKITAKELIELLEKVPPTSEIGFVKMNPDSLTLEFVHSIHFLQDNLTLLKLKVFSGDYEEKK